MTPNSETLILTHDITPWLKVCDGRTITPEMLAFYPSSFAFFDKKREANGHYRLTRKVKYERTIREM